MKPGDMVRLNMVINIKLENADGKMSYSLKPFGYEGWSQTIILTEAELNKAMTNELS